MYPTDHKYAIEEYKTLRTEIIEADKLVSQAITFLAITVGSILSFSISKMNEVSNIGVILVACLISVVMAGFGANIVANQRRRIWRIATHLAVFVEPSLGLYWESALRDARSISEKATSGHIKNERYMFSTIVVAPAAVAVLALLIYWDKEGLPNVLPAVMCLITLALSGLMFWWIKILFSEIDRNGNYPRILRETWDELARRYSKSRS